LVRIETSGEATRQAQLFVHGESATGQPRVEHIPKERVKWSLGVGSLTGERVYGRMDEVEILGLEDNDRVQLYGAGYTCQDQTLLLPLWAGLAGSERAEKLVRKTITAPAHFWRPFGLPACARPAESPEAQICLAVHLPWNSLIGEGLAAFGYQAEAAELVSRLMASVIQSLKQDRAFRRFYHAETGQGFGEKNALSGLAPIGLFLETVGVRLISPQKVVVWGANPFPWPVTVKYRGLTILKQRESSTTVIFPDGQTACVEDSAPRIVSLEKVVE
jgi:hypothetical protein